MTTVFVVDDGAKELCTELNIISNKDDQGVRFVPHPTLERLFADLQNGDLPDLILLHHHWEGLTISQLLERIVQLADSTRVILFTAQSVNPSELIECARSGVADYWTKRGELNPLVVFRQIARYSAGPEWTLRKLRMPSGSQRQLIRGAEACQSQLKAAILRNEELTAKNLALESKENLGFRRLIIRLVTFGVNCAILTTVFIVVNIKASNLPVWGDLVFSAILALFFLFLEGKIRNVFVKWDGGSAQVR